VGRSTGAALGRGGIVSRPASPDQRGTIAWTVNALGNTLYSQNMIVNYFPVWVVAVMGGNDGQIAWLNTIVMSLMLGIGPWLGAMSDRMPRRLPLLMGTTAGSCGLTFFVGGGSFETSLILFLFANLLYQAGLVIYDTLLPAVATPDRRGRVGGIAVAVGYLGAFVGIGIANAVFLAGGEYATIFRLTAVAVLILAVPCFVWVNEPERAVERTAPLLVARGALADVLATLRRSGNYPQLVRFLLGRFCYSQAGNTIGIFLGVYLTVQLGFDSAQKDRLLLSVIIFGVAGGVFWGRVVDRIGPRDCLLRVLCGWAVVLALIAGTGFHVLPTKALWVIAPIAGFTSSGIWAADRPLLIELSSERLLGQFYGLYSLAGRCASLVGPLVWALFVDGLGWGRPVALVVLTGFVLVSLVILRPLPSGMRPQPLTMSGQA
jgi:MFS transporter, UMF1 family